MQEGREREGDDALCRERAQSIRRCADVQSRSDAVLHLCTAQPTRRHLSDLLHTPNKARNGNDAFGYAFTRPARPVSFRLECVGTVSGVRPTISRVAKSRASRDASRISGSVGPAATPPPTGCHACPIMPLSPPNPGMAGHVLGEQPLSSSRGLQRRLRSCLVPRSGSLGPAFWRPAGARYRAGQGHEGHSTTARPRTRYGPLTHQWRAWLGGATKRPRMRVIRC